MRLKRHRPATQVVPGKSGRPRLPGRPANDHGLPAWYGDSLMLRRVHAGWSSTELAERLEVGKSTLLRWESGGSAPHETQVAALCKILGCAKTAFSRPPKIV